MCAIVNACAADCGTRTTCRNNPANQEEFYSSALTDYTQLLTTKPNPDPDSNGFAEGSSLESWLEHPLQSCSMALTVREWTEVTGIFFDLLLHRFQQRENTQRQRASQNQTASSHSQPCSCSISVFTHIGRTCCVLADCVDFSFRGAYAAGHALDQVSAVRPSGVPV